MDLRALQNTSALFNIPQELLDRVKYLVPASEIIRKNVKIVSDTDHALQIDILSHQVDTLF